jgi:DNA-binding MarR family transcriptional regulator
MLGGYSKDHPWNQGSTVVIKLDEPDHPLLTREDMGAVLGITTETASRTIAEFRRKGLIELLEEHRFRCDTAALTRIAA